MQTPSPLAAGRASGRLFLSPSPVPPFLRHRRYNVAIPNTSGRRQPQRRERANQRCDGGGSGDRFIQKIGDERRAASEASSAWREGETDSFFAPPPLSPRSIPSFLPCFPRSFDTHSLGVNYTRRRRRRRRGWDGRNALTHSLSGSIPQRAAPRPCARTTHMLFTISQ